MTSISFHRPACALLSVAFLAGLASAAAWGHGNEMHAATAAAQDYRRSVASYQVPAVTLVDADNRPVRLKELLDGDDPVMVNFIFTTCSAVCPVTTQVFSEVRGRLGQDVRRLRMVSVSIDPEHDTPLELKAYARSFRAGERWHFLTGRSEDIRSVERAFDSYRGDKMNHVPLTLVRRGAGSPWVRLDGFLSSEQLAREYRKAVQQ